MTQTQSPPLPRNPHQLPQMRQILTPEGVPIHVEVAALGDRVGALLIDGALMAAILALTGLVAFLISMVTSAVELGGALWVLMFFLVRCFYFIGWELSGDGRTPGKRRMGLRVMDAAGGALTSEAVLARNFLREAELWLPLGLFAIAAVGETSEFGWAEIAAVAWVFLLALVPFFNRDHRRCGDFVAGTLVISLPRLRLDSDLSSGRAPSRGAQHQELSFTHEQLEIYGIYELEVLEQVLRKPRGRGRNEALRTVSAKIMKKIGWRSEDRVDPETFLKAFYAAQRARLERKMLFGKRKERKSIGP